MTAPLAVRLVKIAMVASLAAFAGLVAVDNVLDYRSNYAFVRHVLGMDTTFPDNALRGRAVIDPALWTAAYAAIIAAEAVVGLVLTWAALRLAANLRARAARFNAAKGLVVVGTGLAFLLWFLGFTVIAGEWFAMWQSSAWNAQEAAFRCYATFLLATIVVCQPDGELDG